MHPTLKNLTYSPHSFCPERHVMSWRITHRDNHSVVLAVVEAENAARVLCDLPPIETGWTYWPERRVSAAAGSLNPVNVDFADLESRVIAASSGPDFAAKVLSLNTMYGISRPFTEWNYATDRAQRRPRPLRDVCRVIAADLMNLATDDFDSQNHDYLTSRIESLSRSLSKAAGEAPDR